MPSATVKWWAPAPADYNETYINSGHDLFRTWRFDVNQFPEIHVLLVDDSPTDRDLIARQLAQVKQLRGTTELSDRLATAMARLERGGIDVVLLDVGLPDSQGLDTVLTIRNTFPEVAIVVLTGVESDDFGLQAIQHGADDYLEKGNMQVEHLARALQYSIIRKRASSADSQLQVARDIQQRLFPAIPPPIAGFDIAAACFPAATTSGDYFDYLQLADGSLGVVIADVSGHGFGAALLMAETRAYLRALTRTGTNLGEVLTTINRILAEDTLQTQFVTMFFVRIDRQGPSFTYTGAGHNAYHFNAAGKVRELPSNGIPLAVQLVTNYKHTKPYPLKKGDVLVMLTDGVAETASPAGEYFGNKRAREIVRQNLQRPAAEIVDALMDAVRAFASGQTQNDDITIVIVKVMG